MESVQSQQQSAVILDDDQLLNTTMTYKVTLSGYWVNAQERIWKTPDNKLYKIDENYNAHDYCNDDDSQLSSQVHTQPPIFKITRLRVSKVTGDHEDEPPQKKKRII